MANLITLTDPRSSAAEAYQTLRTNLEFSSLEKPLHSVLVTSPDDTVDKSVAVANLAVVLAQAGDSVILIDGDMRLPRQHEIFGLQNRAGLATWLAERGDPPLQPTTVEGLQLLAAGPPPANPIALLSQKRLAEALAELQQRCTYILCDAPPVLAVTDAALWASRVDGVVLLVNAGATKRDNAQRAKAMLDKVHAHIIGAVLLNAEQETAMSEYYK